MKSLKFIFVFLFLASFANANCFLSDTAFGKFLRQKEAGGSYRAWNEPNTNFPHIKDGYDVENMTIAEVINHQTPPNRVIHAAGAYQIINTSKAPTLSSAVKSLGLDTNAKFSKEIQDKIFNEYLTTSKKGRSAIHDYFYGNGDLDKAVQSIAYEWSSMPVPNSCNGAYGKALACYDELVKHMKTAKKQLQSGDCAKPSQEDESEEENTQSPQDKPNEPTPNTNIVVGSCLCASTIAQSFKDYADEVIKQLQMQQNSLKKLQSSTENTAKKLKEQNTLIKSENELLKDSILKQTNLLFELEKKVSLR